MALEEPTKSSLEELMQCYLQGDIQACEQLLLYREHRDRVERIARKKTRETLLSWEDAAQDAHEKVFQALRAKKFDKGGVQEFYRWAATVAYHKIIDLVRQEKCRQGPFRWSSLEQQLPGMDMLLEETIANDFNEWDALERADLVSNAVKAILTIDQRYPSRGYLKLWSGRVQDKTQSQLATELGITQSEISKRWQKLLELIADELKLLSSEEIKRELQAARKQKAVRRRSDARR